MSDPLYPPSSDGIDSSFLQRASGQHAGDRTAIDEDSLYECDAPRYADLRQEMEGEMPMTGGTPRMRQKPDGWFDDQPDTPLSQRSITYAEVLYEPTSDSLLEIPYDSSAHVATQSDVVDISGAADDSFLLPQGASMLIGSGDGDITVGGVGNTTIGIGAADVSFIDNMATPRPTRMSAMRVSSLTPGATADDAADEILDENTLTPRPGKQQCPKSASSSSGASRSPAAGISFRSAATDNSALLEESELAEEDEDEAVEQILADAQKRFTNMRVNPFTPVKSSKLSQEVKFEAAEANDDDDENGDEQSEESHSHDATPEPRASMQQNPHKHVSFSGKRQTTKTGTVHVEKPIDRAPMAKTATGIPVKTASTLTVKKSMSTIKSVPKPVVVPAIVPATLVPAAPHDKPPKSASAFPAASTTVAFVPAKSVKPLTVPVEFKFSSRTAHRAITSATVLDTKLASTMAKPAAGKRAVEKKLTVPKPFKFHVVTMKKEPTTDTAKSPYVPLAERVLDFTKTTDRLKKTAAPVLSKPASKNLTIPQSPKFVTSARIKKEHILSTEERQLLELKNHAPFKARPVDQRVLSSAGDLGVPRVKKATTTVAHSPHITKTIKQVDMAKPASPVRIIKANAYVMHKPFQPKIEHRLIKPAQFKLPGEELSARRKQQIEEKKQREEQEMARQRAFKAQPMIVGYEEPVHVQHEHLCVKKATEPKSPMLATKTRGQQYRRVLEEKLDREAALIKAQAEFHARPILEPAQPFVPSHPERPALENQPFHLNTETRSLNRKAFEEEVRQHEKEVELWKKKQQAEDQERARLEVAQLRKQSEFRANPVRFVAQFAPKKSDKPLTEPVSPMFADKRQRAQKQQHA